METLPNKLYVAHTAPDTLSVVNENYPNATQYIHVDKLVGVIKEHLKASREVRNEHHREGMRWALEDVLTFIELM